MDKSMKDALNIDEEVVELKVGVKRGSEAGYIPSSAKCYDAAMVGQVWVLTKK